MNPLINILIRTHRPEKLLVCKSSVYSQTYENKELLLFPAQGLPCKGFDYNLYCNILKAQVTDGWFFFLDDDDALASPTVLEQMAKHLTDPETGIICQFLRNGQPKPSDAHMDAGIIQKGKIGMPCIFLHHSKKDIAQFDNTEAADYNFIKDVAARMPVRFIKQIVVNASPRSYGK